jgi:ketosteroid isomerase-like protein
VGDEELVAANKALVVRWFAALSEMRLDEAWALDDPDGVLWVPALRETMPFPRWHQAYEALMAQQFPAAGVQYEIGPMTAEGNRVSVLTEGSGAMRDGGVYNNLYHWLFWADGSTIQRIDEYMDTQYSKTTIHAAGWSGPMANSDA